MKKNSLSFYAVLWSILFALFNALSIVSVVASFSVPFLIGYIVIDLALIGQLVCAWVSFKDKSPKKTFYNLPLFRVSFTGLYVSAFFGLAFIGLSLLSEVVSIIVGAVVLVVLIINIAAIAKVKMAVDFASNVDKKIEKATAFIYDMRAESEALLTRAKSDEVKAICKKVHDAFQYSDPMSKDALEALDSDIKGYFDLLKKAIIEDRMDEIVSNSDELLALLSERNSKCKRLK